LTCALGIAALATVMAKAAAPVHLLFLSTQLRPIAEAQKMRNVVLKDFPQEVEFATVPPPRAAALIKQQMTGSAHAADLVGALHGELQPFAELDALRPLDALVQKPSTRSIPASLLTLGKLGTAHQLYIPWMQAGYVMVANKKALPYLPKEADLDRLSYSQLAAWASELQEKTGKRLLGFPAGPQGLMHRFIQGFLYPSFTGGVVRSFRTIEAEAMWVQLASLWKSVNPNSTSYNFMGPPLLSDDVWIGFEHIARILDALRQKPGEFIAFPAPSGPKGRGYMPVMAGLAVLKTAAELDSATRLIEYLLGRDVQLATLRSVGFLPVIETELPQDVEPGLRMAAGVIAKLQSADDAVPTSMPLGLGERAEDFDKVFMDAFQLIVLRGQNPRAVLDKQAEILRRLMTEAGAPCWQPEAVTAHPCQPE
jgi:multiple sugar transport system substrate-binding protein